MVRKFLILLVLLSFASIVYAANVNVYRGYHSVRELSKSAYSLDSDGDGYIDKCDSLSEPGTTVNVDTTKPYHPIQQITTTGLTSVDSNNNGWPDVCDSLSEPSSTVNAGAVSHPLSQITKSSSSTESLDSNANGWPDKGDCIFSEISHDNSNCGSCGNVCSSGRTCCSGSCCSDTCCSGTCSNIQNDNSNCGTCGHACGAGLTCCSGTCKNLQTDSSNCGTCGHVCDTNYACQTGSCVKVIGTWTLVGTGCLGTDCTMVSCDYSSAPTGTCTPIGAIAMRCGGTCGGATCRLWRFECK